MGQDLTSAALLPSLGFCPQEEEEARKQALFTEYQSGKVELHMRREKNAERINNYNAAILRCHSFSLQCGKGK